MRILSRSFNALPKDNIRILRQRRSIPVSRQRIFIKHPWGLEFLSEMTPPFSAAGTLNSLFFSGEGFFAAVLRLCAFAFDWFWTRAEGDEVPGGRGGGVHWTFCVVGTRSDDMAFLWWSRYQGKGVGCVERDGRGCQGRRQ